jgi:hypothetical protein
MNEDLGEITKKMEKLGKNKEVDGKKKGSSSGDMKGISTQSTPDVCSCGLESLLFCLAS